jgi:hypothetical protein
VFVAWTRMALTVGTVERFLEETRAPDVAAAIVEVDALVGRLFANHFGDPAEPEVQRDYFEAMFAFAIDSLPPAVERDARIAADDFRKATAGRHTLDGDLMWFAWALHTEAASALLGADAGRTRRALQLAGVAMGCGANFAWRGHRRTREEYRADAATEALLKRRATGWASDFASAADEVHALFRIREWGGA